MIEAISAKNVYVVWNRHLQVYRKNYLTNCLSGIYDPLFFLLAFSFGLAPLVGTVDLLGRSVPFVDFVAPAMIVLGCFYQSLSESTYCTFIAIHFTKQWSARLTTSLTFDEIFLGDLAWATTKGFLTGLLVTAIAAALGTIPIKVAILIQPVLLLGSACIAALGFIIAGSVKMYINMQSVLQYSVTPVLVLSGVYFPRSVLPEPLQSAAAILPLSPILDLVRAHLIGGYLLSKLLWLVAMAIIALLLARKVMYRRVLGL